MTAGPNDCRLAITSDRICIIIPNQYKMDGPVRIDITNQNDDITTFNIRKDNENGIRGSITSGLDKTHWTYERRIKNYEGHLKTMGRTRSEIVTVDEGLMSLKTSEPYARLITRSKKGFGRAKQKYTLANQSPPPASPTNSLSSLRSLVNNINMIKGELGKSLILEINPETGKLRALVEYGE